MTTILRGIIAFALCATVQATIIPVDLGPPKVIKGGIGGGIFLSADGLDGTPVNGQMLSLDYQFSSLLHIFPGQSEMYVAIRAETNMIPISNGIYPSVTSSAYAVGLNGFQSTVKYDPGNTLVGGSNVTEILFGLCYPAGQNGSALGLVSSPGLYLTGMHFDLTLPDLQGVEITGLTLHLDSALRDERFSVLKTVPENTNSIALLAFSFVMLALFRHKILHIPFHR